jgi:hypothetical protein
MSREPPTPQTSEFNKTKYVPNGSGEDGIKTSRKKYAKHKDKRTSNKSYSRYC